MKWSGFASVYGRRTFTVLTVAGLLSSAPAALAQQAPAAPPADQPAAGQAPAAPAKDEFMFSSDAVILLWAIKSERTADFESVWNTIRAKLATSDKPELKAIGDTMKIFKVDAPPSASGVSYMMMVDPVVKTTTYNPVKILYDSGLFTREEADPLFQKLSTTYNGINPLPLMRITSSGQMPMPAAAPPAQ
jgi:uncharacterized lipoprotein YehR (DUF1307 family)